mgnify:CR=1 FL=1
MDDHQTSAREWLGGVAQITVMHNNGLHQTGREGVAFAFRRRPVVEARPAGEAGCSTDLDSLSREAESE